MHAPTNTFPAGNCQNTPNGVRTFYLKITGCPLTFVITWYPTQWTFRNLTTTESFCLFLSLTSLINENKQNISFLGQSNGKRRDTDRLINTSHNGFLYITSSLSMRLNNFFLTLSSSGEFNDFLNAQGHGLRT